MKFKILKIIIYIHIPLDHRRQALPKKDHKVLISIRHRGIFEKKKIYLRKKYQ